MQLKMCSVWPVLYFGLLFYSAYGYPSPDEEMQNDEEGEKVQGPPPEAESQPMTVIVEEGGSVTLPCKIKNKHKFALLWTFNANESLFVETHKFVNDEHYKLNNDSSLTVVNFTKQYAGKYACKFHTVEITHTVGYKEKSTGDGSGGASSNFSVSFLCILFAVLTRLWSC